MFARSYAKILHLISILQRVCLPLVSDLLELRNPAVFNIVQMIYMKSSTVSILSQNVDTCLNQYSTGMI